MSGKSVIGAPEKIARAWETGGCVLSPKLHPFGYGSIDPSASDFGALRTLGQTRSYVCSMALARSSALGRNDMAIFVPGMRCAISGRPISSAGEAVTFPAFVANEADPLHRFSDAVVHAHVFRAHPLAGQVQARLEEARRLTAPESRLCLICGELIMHPDDYVGLGYLVDDLEHPLYRFNYAHFHHSHLAIWPELPELITELVKLDASGAWKGDGLKHVIGVLRSAT